MRAPKLGFVAALLVLTVAAEVSAHDHFNLSEDLPIRVEDAFATGYLNREVQLLGRWEHHGGEEDDDHFILEPRIEFGAYYNLEVEVAVPFRYTEEPDELQGSGDIRLSALYNFNMEGLYVPAFAVAGGIDVPTGHRSRGVDTRLKLILTKTLGETNVLNRVHLNAVWLHNSRRRDDERQDRYELVLGYSIPVSSDLVLLADVVRRQGLEKDVEVTLLEAGFRWQAHPLTILGAGGSAGVGDESPDAGVTFFLQQVF